MQEVSEIVQHRTSGITIHHTPSIVFVNRLSPQNSELYQVLTKEARTEDKEGRGKK